MKRLRFEARPEDRLQEGDQLIAGGDEFTVTDERAAELLAIPGLVSEPAEVIDLHDKTRAELNDLARQSGIEAPEKLRNIPAVIAAIERAQEPEQQTEPAQGSDQNPDTKEE